MAIRAQVLLDDLESTKEPSASLTDHVQCLKLG
jgi:hypothetical protein